MIIFNSLWKKVKQDYFFLDTMINKSGTKILMDIYNKLTDSKPYVPFTSNHPRHFLTNTTFSLARRIRTIVQNENTKEKLFKKLKKNIARTKYPKALIEASILRDKEIPREVLKQPETTKSEEIIRFATTHNPKNPNVFPIIKQKFDNFQYSKTMSNIFQMKKLVKSLRQAPALGRFLCRSKFSITTQKSGDKKLWKELCQPSLSFKSILIPI